METFNYCNKCILQEGYGIVLSEKDGLCPSCLGYYGDEMFHKVEHLHEKFNDFKKYTEKRKTGGEYDCLLMLSGGKDSVYMLHKLVNIDKLKPLAFTIDHPFESHYGRENIEKTIKKIDVEHIMFTPNSAYKELLKHIFTMETEDIAAKLDVQAPEKIPCIICSSYMEILSFLFSKKMGIPYILYCADPNQMFMAEDSMENIITNFYKFCGEELVHKLFGTQLDHLKDSDFDSLPKIVYPYISENYDRDTIISEVKRLGLYDSSPHQTHCTLYGLLNYFSVKNFNRVFYVTEFAVDVRNGRIGREIAIKVIEQFKRQILEIAAHGNVGEETKQNLGGIVKYICSSDAELEYLLKVILNMHDTAKELGFEIFGKSSETMKEADSAIYDDEACGFEF